MKVIIAGCRYISSVLLIEQAVKESGFYITEVVSGGCRGIDICGEEWANVKCIRITIFNAEWKKHGKKAGMMRNGVMAQYGDALIAIWDGESRGAKNMIDLMRKKNKPVYILEVKL
jgi:hypothetical protein